MTNKEVIYDIKESIKAYSSDASTTSEYIMYVVDSTRAKYIRQHQARNPGEPKRAFSQTLYVSLERADRAYVGLNGFSLGSIVRSVKPIPSIVGKTILKPMEVRPMDRISSEIVYMDKVRAIVANDPKFIFSFLDDDGHLYFTNKGNNLHLFLEKVAVSTILEHPKDIILFNELEDSTFEYPMTEALWSLMRPEVLQHFQGILNIPADTVTDNNDIR